MVTDEPGVCVCFCPPSNVEQCCVWLAWARSRKVNKAEYLAVLKRRFIEAPLDRLEFILDKYAKQLADNIRLEVYIASMERYSERHGREDVWGQLDRISAKYESTMNTQQLFEAMGDIAFK